MVNHVMMDEAAKITDTLIIYYFLFGHHEQQQTCMKDDSIPDTIILCSILYHMFNAIKEHWYCCHLGMNGKYYIKANGKDFLVKFGIDTML